jgi:hypothetical protein
MNVPYYGRLAQEKRAALKEVTIDFTMRFIPFKRP